MTDINLTLNGATTNIGGVIFADVDNVGSGTGSYAPFLAIRDNDGNEVGFNTTTDANVVSNPNIDASKTHEVLLANVPIVRINGIDYFEIRLDLNEPGSDTLVSLNAFKIYAGPNDLDPTAGVNYVDTLTELNSLALVYDMDALATGGDKRLLLDKNSSGSGTDDYSILIPVSLFAGRDPATTYVFLYADMGTASNVYDAESGFEEFNLQSAGSLVGTKFNDLDNDGVRDTGEPGLAGVTVFIDANKDGILNGDTNGNGIQDAGEIVTERFTRTDANGNYTFSGVALGTWQIDEVVPVGSAQTTGLFETATISSAGQVVIVDPIGNHYPVPHIVIDKAFVNITDGPDGGNTTGSTTVIDGAGDIANYTIKVTNDGETALTNVIVTDALATSGAIAVLKTGGFNSGDSNSNGVLDMGETWNYTATQTATQADLDTNGGTNDGDKDNSATVVATQQGTAVAVTATDTAAAPIQQSASLAITKVFNGWSGGDGDSFGDFAGDLATYTIVVKNTGNVTLTNVVVTDPLTGNSYNVGTLAPDASSAPLSEIYTLTQADLDSNGTSEAGNFKAGSIENTATATSGQTGPAAASAVAPIVYDPKMTIVKELVSVTNGNLSTDSDGKLDSPTDIATYSIKVTNTGNVTLENILVTDDITGNSWTIVSLAPGASDTHTDTYSPTQAYLDSLTADTNLINIATATDDEAGKVSDDAAVPVDYDPSVDIEKLVSTTGGTNLANYIDADTALAGYQNVAVQADVFFAITAQNTGNVTLTNVVITDVSSIGGGTTTVLFTGGSLTAAALALGATLSGDTNGDGKLDVSESWTILYNTDFEFGQHVNTASITNTQGATDSDAAYYFGIMEGPGVRTPGFWQGLNNGALFWDGIQGNSKTGAGFTENGDLLIYGKTNGTVDSNNDGFVTSADKGLLIGDYNLNGKTDIGEDTLWISYTDATQLIDSSQKTQAADGVQKLGRDLVATWLNYLAGNGIGGESDIESPRHFIDDAIDYLQTFGDAINGAGGNIVNPLETFDRYSLAHTAVKSSSAFWNTPQGGIDHSASSMHSALDNYNNTGDTIAGGDPYAMNSHSAFDMTLIMASQPVI